MTISLQLIRETPRWERDMITVSLGEVFGDDKYPWMTLTMSLDKYNEFNTPMPRFLIGQQYDIIIRSWEDGCECDEDFSEHDWNKKTCAMEEPETEICGEFIFHLMPHEFFQPAKKPEYDYSHYGCDADCSQRNQT